MIMNAFILATIFYLNLAGVESNPVAIVLGHQHTGSLDGQTGNRLRCWVVG